MIEEQVEQMLRRRAAEAPVDPEAWTRITERIAQPAMLDETWAAAAGRRRLRGPVVLGTLAAAALAALATVAVLDGGREERVRVADGDGTNQAGLGPAGTATRPIWPAATDGGILRLQAEADAGRRPDLLDPVAVAAGYLSDRFLDVAPGRPTQDFAVGGYTPAGLPDVPGAGSVVYSSPPDRPAGGSVEVRRAGGEGSVWFVVGSRSPAVDVEVAAYDGSEVSARVTVADPGTLELTLSATEGDPVMVDSFLAEANRPVEIGQRFAGHEALLLAFRHTAASGTVSLAEIRVDRLPAPAPPPSGTPEEAAARRWASALAAGEVDVAWDLMGEHSRAAFGSRAGFGARLAEVRSEWAGWEGPETPLRVVVLDPPDMAAGSDPPPDLPTLAVVVRSGGGPAGSASSLPVRTAGAVSRVEPSAVAEVSLEPPVSGDSTVVGAYTPASARVWFVVDGRPPAGPSLVEAADGDLQHATLDLAGLPAGRHSLTVVVLTVDGRLASRSASFVSP